MVSVQNKRYPVAAFVENLNASKPFEHPLLLYRAASGVKADLRQGSVSSYESQQVSAKGQVF